MAAVPLHHRGWSGGRLGTRHATGRRTLLGVKPFEPDTVTQLQFHISFDPKMSPQAVRVIDHKAEPSVDSQYGNFSRAQRTRRHRRCVGTFSQLGPDLRIESTRLAVFAHLPIALCSLHEVSGEPNRTCNIGRSRRLMRLPSGNSTGQTAQHRERALFVARSFHADR